MTKTIEETYKKMSHHEHVLEKSDMYIGSISTIEEDMYVYEDNRIIKKKILFNPGLYKLFDEVLVNARDHTIKCKTCNIIKIEIDNKNNCISVYNNGDGIPIEIHKEYKIYVPELIFGNLLTSTNYTKNEEVKSITGGKYGLGVKLTNIWSTKFIVETCDGKNEYKQVFENNMYKKYEPIIKKIKKGIQQYTKITFYPDLERFKLEGFGDDIMRLFEKRAYDMAVCSKNVSIYYDNKLIPIKSFEEYIKLYYNTEVNVIYYEIERWQIGIVVKEFGDNDSISFVNSICTYKNGTHVTYIINQIVKNITEIVEKKYKMEKIKPSFIKDNIDVYVNAVIENPDFQSQTKDTLTTQIKNFGSKCELTKEFYERICTKTKLIEIILELQETLNKKLLKKTNGITNNKNMILDIPKLEDALVVLSGKRNKNTLMIFTEGDSAKTFALNGRTIIGEENIGVFPLKGKLMNARNCTSINQYIDCEELKHINMILGLKHNMKYTTTNELRYSRVLILTDQDVDGAHIKGLFINYIQCFWPELLILDNFIYTLSTPLIKVYKKGDKKQLKPIEFFSEQDYNNWVKKNDITLYQKPQYYKGLGTSSKEEAKELFKKFNDILITFKWDKTDSNIIPYETKKKGKKIILKIENDDIRYSESYNKIRLVFDKDLANERKIWLSNYDKNLILDYKQKEITYSEFIEKDMKHFSNYDNIRSIPSIIDGFKSCQRKILYVALKEKMEGLERNKKVELLAASVSEKTAYKHGEQSLKLAIINMGQKFVNSNNINFLYPKSEFGTRRCGGEDHGAPRYIFCYLNELTSYIFRKEDECILVGTIEEGMEIEPEHYYPIIPTILINGAKGIGTGYSTDIPLYNPEDVINNMIMKIETNKFKTIDPWYKNFTGTIMKIGEQKYKVFGKYQIKNNICIITELPINIWHDDYKEYIYNKIKNENKIINIKNKCDNDKIYFEIEFNVDDLQELIKKNELEKYLQMSSIINLSNMHIYDSNSNIKKYNNVIEIFEEFYILRLQKYKQRKEYYVKILENKLNIIKYRVKFINQILNKEIIIERKNKEYIINELIKNKYPELSIQIDSDKGYEYLINLPLFVLTEEQINKYNEDLRNINKEMEIYINTTESDLWKTELYELLAKYKVWIKGELNEELEGKLKKKK